MSATGGAESLEEVVIIYRCETASVLFEMISTPESQNPNNSEHKEMFLNLCPDLEDHDKSL